jgi:hypothetical protein
MAFDIEQFREDFPEFLSTSPQVYSDSLITFWAGIGDLQLNEKRWGDFRPYGMELFVAHHITIAIADQNAVLLGGMPGQATTLKSNKSVGDVSVGIDTGASLESKGGNFNLTSYGREFIRLARIVGSGGAVVL